MTTLSKSRFKLGMTCPTKVYYASHPKLFTNRLKDDAFLKTLADGGFQIEAYVHDVHFNNKGFENKDRTKTRENLERTKAWMKKEEVLIHEAAVTFENLLVYVDVLQKKGGVIHLYEVKAKSTQGQEGFRENALGKRGGIKTGWRPYLWDIAFQKYVVQRAYPEFPVRAHLIIVDKSKSAAIDGLNQMYKVRRNGDFDIEIIRPQGAVKLSDQKETMTVIINVDDIIEGEVFSGKDKSNDRTFMETLELCKEYSERDQPYPSILNPSCNGCEFFDESGDPDKSGWHRCWKQSYSDSQLAKPLAYEVWNLRSKKLFEFGVHFMEDLSEDLVKNEEGSVSFTNSERQWAQINSQVQRLRKDVVKDGLEHALDELEYPLNFIDFETSMGALPFFKGMSPYERIAFQFSHHILHADGRVEHYSQFLNTTPGEFPNFDFVRVLKESLSANSGTVFQYHPYENQVLNGIYEQLDASSKPDRAELIQFIASLTEHKARGKGERCMVDLKALVKDYWYHPAMGGSISIKKVLPAAIASSSELEGWLKQPMSEAGISSLNDDSHVWLPSSDSTDPYASLPFLFGNMSEAELEKLLEADEDSRVADGAAAMTAYGRLQYTEVTGVERSRLEQGLLQYCELDTLAMVVVFNKLRELAR